MRGGHTSRTNVQQSPLNSFFPCSKLSRNLDFYTSTNGQIEKKTSHSITFILEPCVAIKTSMFSRDPAPPFPNFEIRIGIWNGRGRIWEFRLAKWKNRPVVHEPSWDQKLIAEAFGLRSFRLWESWVIHKNLNMLIEPPGGVSKEPGKNPSRGVLLHTVLGEGT